MDVLEDGICNDDDDCSFEDNAGESVRIPKKISTWQTVGNNFLIYSLIRRKNEKTRLFDKPYCWIKRERYCSVHSTNSRSVWKPCEATSHTLSIKRR